MAEHEKARHFAVIGLGVFGSNLVRYLAQQKVEILGIDRDARKVEQLKEFLKVPVVCDASERRQLEEAGVNAEDIDVAVVAIGENVETSIYVTLLLGDLGIKTIVARALNNQHAKILAKIGVDKIVFPEANAAEQLARMLTAPHIVDEFELSEEHSISEIVAPDSFFKKSLRELNIRARFHVTVIAIRRKTPVLDEETGSTDLKTEVILSPDAEERIVKGDVLIVAGRNDDIESLKNAS